VGRHTSWGFGEGDEIVPGRHAVRLLGGGRRYEAYLAWDDTLHALVAVKIVRPALAEDERALRGIAAEARLLDRLSHPGIVRAFDAVLEGDRPHLVLEFLDGPRLSTLIRRHGVVVEQLAQLALELCSGLHYLRSRRVVHLDVKPRNVVMTGPPRLIDLSVARPLEELAGLSTPVGTDAYMAPEQCQPLRFDELGPPADVWGLGATLYECLARAQAFPRLGEERFPQLRRRPEPLPADVPPELAELVAACLEPAPLDRPAPAELAAALQPIAAGLPRPRLGLFRPGGRTRQSLFRLDETTLRQLSPRA
jgi:eukaryotic-like serine/threonine-protein kinase